MSTQTIPRGVNRPVRLATPRPNSNHREYFGFVTRLIDRFRWSHRLVMVILALALPGGWGLAQGNSVDFLAATAKSVNISVQSQSFGSSEAIASTVPTSQLKEIGGQESFLTEIPEGTVYDCDDHRAKKFYEDGYKLIFNGWEHDSIECKTYYYYCIKNNGKSPAISHYLFGSSACYKT